MQLELLKLPRFPKKIELRFQTEHAQLTRGVVRVSIPVGILTYLSFFFWDLGQPGADTATSFVIRFSFVLMCAAGLLFTLSDSFLRWAQEVMFALVTTGATGVAVILYIFDDGFVVGVAGVCLVIMFGCSLGMLRFSYAGMFSLVTIAICNVLVFFDESSYERSFVLLNTNFFLVSFSVFSLVFSYLLELHLRRRFRDTGVMVRWTEPVRLSEPEEHGVGATKRVFVCYRRSGTADVTGRIQDRLAGIFGNEVFVKDVEVVPLGADYRPFLGRLIRKCALMLAIVGADWRGGGAHSTSIDDQHDPVRTEIELAMNLNIPIIPVLVQGVQMPKPDELPQPIRGLAYLNAAVVRPDPDFHRDIEHLTDQLRQALQDSTSVR
jgi:hypothetical protein